MPLRLRPFLLLVTSLSLSSLSVSTRPMGLFTSFCCSSTTGDTCEAFATRLDGVGWLSFVRLTPGRGMMRGRGRALKWGLVLLDRLYTGSHCWSGLQERANPRSGLCYSVCCGAWRAEVTK